MSLPLTFMHSVFGEHVLPGHTWVLYLVFHSLLESSSTTCFSSLSFLLTFTFLILTALTAILYPLVPSIIKKRNTFHMRILYSLPPLPYPHEYELLSPPLQKPLFWNNQWFMDCQCWWPLKKLGIFDLQWKQTSANQWREGREKDRGIGLRDENCYVWNR